LRLDAIIAQVTPVSAECATEVNLMNKGKTTHILFYLFLVVAFFSVRAFVDRELAGGTAPEIQAITVNGKAFDLPQFEGKPALIYFWASWCSICKAMRHSIDAIAQDYPVMTLALQSGDAAKVKRFMQAQRICVPVVPDPDGAIGRSYGIRGVPAAFVLGPDGAIRFASAGYTSELGLRLRLWLAGIMG
jgi:thiol-disulfide isomerase/thioredoxin